MLFNKARTVNVFLLKSYLIKITIKVQI